ESRVGPRLDLPEPGEAGRNQEALEVMRREELELVRNERARTDKRHLATEHVEELRQLIEAPLAQPAADACSRVATVELVQIVRSRQRVGPHDLLDVFAVRGGIGALAHRPELEQSE